MAGEITGPPIHESGGLFFLTQFASVMGSRFL